MRRAGAIGLFLLLSCFAQIFVQAEAASAKSANESNYYRYHTRAGDTLGSILNTIDAHPIWGKHGNVQRCLGLNPFLETSHGDLIISNQWLKLPADLLGGKATNPNYTINQKTREIFLTARSEKKIERAIASSPEPAASSSSGFLDYSYWKISPRAYFSKLSAKDSSSGAKSVLSSGLNYGGTLGWHPVFSESFELGFEAGVDAEKYTTTGESLHNESLFLPELAITSTVRLSKNTALGAKIDARQAPFVRGQPGQSLTIDKVIVPEAGLFLDQKLLGGDGVALSLELDGRVDGSRPAGSYTVRTGYGFGGKLLLGQSVNKSRGGFEAGVFGDEQIQNTSITTQSELKAGVFFSISIDP